MVKKRKKKKRLKKKIKILLWLVLLSIIALIGYILANYYYAYSEELKPEVLEKEYYNISDFGFVNEKTGKDQNNNGLDDIEDILIGERETIKNNPKYISKYYQNGYAPKNEGVCTDVVWYCFNKAGYDLKKLISQDIQNTKKKNIYGVAAPDVNIDFRRVGNQEIFLMRYAENLDTDMYNLGSFMPGDILTFDNSAHIAMVGEKYNKNGVPYLVQNRDEKQKQTEEDRLEKTDMKVTGHYRLKSSSDLTKIVNQVNKRN